MHLECRKREAVCISGRNFDENSALSTPKRCVEITEDDSCVDNYDQEARDYRLPVAVPLLAAVPDPVPVDEDELERTLVEEQADDVAEPGARSTKQQRCKLKKL